MFRVNKKNKSILKSIQTLHKCEFNSPEYEEFDLYQVPSFVFKTEFPDHKEIKQDMLKAIASTATAPSDFHTLTKHDWNVPSSVPRQYDMLFRPRILKLCNKLISNYTCQNFNYWFNQYEPGVDECFIHIHQGSTISGVYFLELEKHEDSTIFVSPDARNGYQIPVKEGDVLLWDPMLPHLAPKTKGAKTVISFNLV